MRTLIVGGAGYVGSIIRPGLEQRHECWHFDQVPPAGAPQQRVIIGDVNDDEAVARAVDGMEAVVYLAMGKDPQGRIHELSAALSVNTGGAYRFLRASLAGGTRRFIYASSLSVYENLRTHVRQDENKPPDAWTKPYGVSKRLGEAVCAMAAEHHPDATIIALRMMLPQNDQDWSKPTAKVHLCPLGPEDTRQLFVAALEVDRSGLHIVQASGDLEGKLFPNDAVEQLTGWRPQGK